MATAGVNYQGNVEKHAVPKLASITTRVPLAKLSHDPANARKHDARNLEAITASLQRFGQVEQLVVQKASRRVIGGNGRLTAMKAMGWKEADVVELDIDDVQATALGIALNRSAELAEWDNEALAALLQSLPDEVKIDTGFSDADMEALLKELTPPVEIAEDDVPEAQAVEITRKGDVWLLGEHRLLCGDSTKADPPECDLVVTSPPYNCDIDYASHDDKMDPKAYIGFIESIVAVAAKCIRPGCFIAWNVGVTPKSMHFEHAAIMARAGLTFYRQIVWAKAGVAFPIWQYTNAARKYHPNYCHEVIYLFTNGEPKAGAGCEPDDRFSKDVWQIHQSSASRDLPGVSNGRRPRNSNHGGSKAAAHPAAYPIGIPEGVIKHLTGPGELIYDPFIGSGTTIIAAEQLGRRCYGIEISPQYVDVAVRRWQKLTGKDAVLESTGETFTQREAAPA